MDEVKNRYSRLYFVAPDGRYPHKNHVLYKALFPLDMPLKDAVIQAWEEFAKDCPGYYKGMIEGRIGVSLTAEPDPQLRSHAIYPKGSDFF